MRGWTLRTRLVLAAIGLVAAVSAVIATVTAIALSSYLYHQLDEQLRGVAARAGGPGETRDLDFLGRPGQPFGTLGARLDAEGAISAAAVTAEPEPGQAPTPDERVTALDADQLAALTEAAGNRRPDDVEVPRLGEYRAVTVSTPEGELLVGLPTAAADATVRTLVVVECLVAGAGLVAAGVAAAAVVRIALRPLRRVAATATRVSRLPLSHGEVSLPDRVPAAEADTRTEVGQVGAALNRLLGHVGAALSQRHDSEQRVRRFVADASHELRTPLASIRGYAELTRRNGEEVGPDTRHALRRIESESTRMTGLVADLLLLARLDSGRPLELAEVDLSALLVDVFADAHAADLAGAVGDTPVDDARGPAEPWGSSAGAPRAPAPAQDSSATAAADSVEVQGASARPGPVTAGDSSADAAHGPAEAKAPAIEPDPAAPPTEGEAKGRNASPRRWVLELPDEPIVIRADRQRLHQALANILANARVHTPPGTTVIGRVERPGTIAGQQEPVSLATEGAVTPGPAGPGPQTTAEAMPFRETAGPGAGAAAEPPAGESVTAGRAVTEPPRTSTAEPPAAAQPPLSTADIPARISRESAEPSGTETPPPSPTGPRTPENSDAGAVVVIRDDGPGVPPHLLPHVFERFSRGDSSRSRFAGSTGLGLAIVSAIAAAHDGEVTIDSRPGATTVRLRLP